MKKGLLLIFALVLTVTAKAHVSRQTAKALAANRVSAKDFDPNRMLMSVVKIVNHRADLFSATPAASVGTGFFVGVRDGKGIIFTNRHVISSSSSQAQLLTLEFNTDQTRGEVIQARLQFVSPIHDFAVLEFDYKKLKRADLSQALRLPNAKSPFYDFIKNERELRGVEVMAIGNPLSTTNITTFGHLTGLYFDPQDGPFIQTQTPINPGNSGGPLISLDTLEVIGINTRTYLGADGTHQSIPIGILIDEYMHWLKQKEQKSVPNVEQKRSIPAAITTLSESEARLLELDAVIEKALPGYWDSYSHILKVTDVEEGSSLQNDDILLTMNGQRIGGYSYDLRRAMQLSGLKAQVQVLRQAKVVDVEVPVFAFPFNEMRVTVDYVYVSGLLFSELPKHNAHKLYPGSKERVIIQQFVESPEANFSGRLYPPPASLVKSVNLGGREYPIQSLSDLRRAINEHREAKYMILRAYKANHMETEDGNMAVVSPRTGAPFFDGVLEAYHIPMTEVVTPFQMSLHKFRKQFKFAAEGGKTRNWRAFVQADRLPSICSKLLKTPVK